ncbi:hypothetical protein AB0H88_48095 [Nonomuraea sp. NPDC050680]|uniref:hypothetical protein n=1 Tax=Nonomuraea sp. NPDC050680 TaxID=3154630 RepID=UPI0033EDF2B8
MTTPTAPVIATSATPRRPGGSWSGPAMRLARLAELRAMLDEVTAQAMAAAMADAQAEGWGLRRIGKHAGVWGACKTAVTRYTRLR